jgi:hypothetical protein
VEIQTGRGWAAEPSPGDHTKKSGVPKRNRPPEPQPGVFLFLGPKAALSARGLYGASRGTRAGSARALSLEWPATVVNRPRAGAFGIGARISSPEAKAGFAWLSLRPLFCGSRRFTPLLVVPICVGVRLRVGLCGLSGPRRRRRRGGWQRPRGGRGGSPGRIGSRSAGRTAAR